jgi:hypothetical protein
MAYKESDFAACVFNPLKKEKMIVAYPKLTEIILPEWSSMADLDMLIRYVSLMYDSSSPLIREERDINYRKSIAANLAGFDLDDEPYMDSIYNFTHGYLVDLVVKFLIRFIKSKEFTAIIVIENCFWESTKKLLEPISGRSTKDELESVQKKAAIKSELDNDIARLEKYYASFFGGDSQLESKAKGRVTPESIAKLK